MNTSDGSVPPGDALKAARARLASAEASVALAKEDAKAAKKRRKEAKDLARGAKKRLRRAKKELDEARRAVVSAEQRQPRLVAPRQLQPIARTNTLPRFIVPRLVVPAKRKARRRAAPTMKANGSDDAEKQISQNGASGRIDSRPVIAPPNPEPPIAPPPPSSSPESAG